MGVQLPLRVQGYDVDGARWEEMTTGEDISSGGAAFPLQHPVAKGQAIVLSMPLPKRYRAFDVMAASYRVYALVRKVDRQDAGYRVGTMFLGKNAPRGFDENPSMRYLLPGEPSAAPAKDGPSNQDRRVQPRFEVFLNLRLNRDSDALGGLEEQTVAENLSRNGAQVPTTLPVAKGEILSVEEMGGAFRSRAEVRNVFIGKDNIPRLNLRFLDPVPDRLISS
jgi:hypothetical protein